MIVLVLSLALAFSTACAKKATSNRTSDDSSSKEEEEKPTDKQTLPNGDFEWYTDDVSASSPYSTGIKWSRYLGGDTPNKAPSSEGRYGVIDTSKYEDLDDKYKPEDKSNPGTPTIAEGTKYLDENVKQDGKKILVIQNKYKTGTAQYMSPSKSVSIPAGSVGVFSVYVKTKDIAAPNSDEPTGAYIRLTGTVGSSIDPVYIENIDTKGAWVRYIVTIDPSVTSTTSISFALGLGKGNEKNMSGYAEGFAYFDNASFVVVKKSEAPADADIDAKLDYTSGTGKYVADEKDALSEGITERTIDVNFAKAYESKTVSGTGDYNEIRTDKTNGVTNKVMKAGDANASDDFKVGYGNATLKLDGKDEEVKDSIYMVFPKTGKDGKAVFGSSYSYTIDSIGGAALSVKKADYSVDENSITYYRLSFLAKVKTAASSQSGASVVVMDNGKESSSGKFSYFTTTEEDGKYNDGYVRYTLYICTKYEEDMNFSVKFSFGPTDNTADPRTLPTGYAIFKDFTFDMLDGDKVYNEATSTNVVKLSLLGEHLEDYTKDDDTKEKDSYNITVSDIDAKTVLPKAAVNVYDSNASVKILTEQDGNQIGIVNSQYRADYPVSYLGAAGILNDLEGKIQGDNKHVQALMVANARDAETVLYMTEKTITSNGSAEFAIKVRVDQGQTKAVIRLFKIATLESGEEDGNLSLNIKNGESAKDYVASVAVTDNNAAGLDGWTTIRFFVKAGDDAMKLRLEFGVSGGAALFDLVSDSKSVTTEDELKNAFDDYKFDGKGVEARTGYYYENEEDVGKENKRLKDKDGKVRTIELDAETVYAYALPKTVTADVTDENATVRLYRFDVKDYVIETADDSSDDDSGDDSTDTPAKTTNTEGGKVAWLNIVSIIIAAVIVVALLAIVIKKFVDDRKRKKAKTQSYYSGYDQTSAHENGSRYSVRNAKKLSLIHI